MQNYYLLYYYIFYNNILDICLRAFFLLLDIKQTDIVSLRNEIHFLFAYL